MNAPATKIIAIVGGSGAGKTWLVQRLCAVLGDRACHLALDDFYRDRSHLPLARRAQLNFDVPRAIDWRDAARVLRDCRAGRPTQIPRYDFATYSRVAAGQPWQPSPIVLVDGLWLLRSPELRPLFDLKVFLDTPTPLRLERRVRRDTAERGYTADDVQDRLTATVLPMHERYVEPQKRWADIVLSQPFQEADVNRLADRLHPLLQETGVFPASLQETFRAELLSVLVAYAYSN